MIQMMVIRITGIIRTVLIRMIIIICMMPITIRIMLLTKMVIMMMI